MVGDLVPSREERSGVLLPVGIHVGTVGSAVDVDRSDTAADIL